MTKWSPLVPLVWALALWSGATRAAALPDVFRHVSGSVVVVLIESHSLGAAGQEGRASSGGLGSGVLISRSGDVLTAAHVVDAADRVRVRFATGDTVVARVVASDPMTDLALLRVTQVPPGAVVASLGDSDRVQVADQVFVVGAPYGISETLSVGYVSARRAPGSGGAQALPVEVLQTDAAVAQGNSGGPMFDMRGEVVGIVSYIISRSGGSEGFAFAIASNAARDLLSEMPSPWTGLTVVALYGDLATLLNLPQPAGLLVTYTAEGSPSARLGLRAGMVPAQIGGADLVLGGDIILSVAGLQVEATADNYRQIRDRLRQTRPGEPLAITVLREGRVVALNGPWESSSP